ncbi:unnamed protein product [Closterium sp. NIES-65]|nr:unnamed protein product [Closterium sp. NIES-65]
MYLFRAIVTLPPRPRSYDRRLSPQQRDSSPPTGTPSASPPTRHCRGSCNPTASYRHVRAVRLCQPGFKGLMLPPVPRSSAYPVRFHVRAPRSAFHECGADDDGSPCAYGNGTCRSQPRSGPGRPGVSDAPSRRGAGRVRSLAVVPRAAGKALWVSWGGVPPSSWACLYGPSASAAADVLAHAATTSSATPCSPCRVAGAPGLVIVSITPFLVNVASTVSPATGANGATLAVSSSCPNFTSSPRSSASTCAARVVAKEMPSPSHPPCLEDFPWESLPPATQDTPHSEALQHRWSPWGESPSIERALRVEQRVGHVGNCLTLLAMILDQLHAYQQLLSRPRDVPSTMSRREQEEAAAEAMEMLRMLPAIGLVPGTLNSALGQGLASLRWLALAALQAPRDIVPAAASVLRWMDGQLCWILAE